MRVNTKEIIKDFDGSELNYILHKNKENLEPPLTVKDAIVLAINQYYNDEIRTAEQITQITGLSHKFYESSEVELTEGDRVFIKDRILKAVQIGLWKPVVYDFINNLLTVSEDKSNDNV